MLQLWSPVFHGFPCHMCDSVSMFCNSTSNLLLCFGVFWYCSWTQGQSPYTSILICVCGLMRTDKATLTCGTKTVQLWKTLTFTWKRNILYKFWNNRFLKFHIYIHTYTGCHRRNGPNFGRVFLMLNYTNITQNTYIQSWTVTEIMAREKCGQLAFPRNVRLQL